MPRKPTGRPTGRPTGSVHFANQERIAVVLPGEMAERLDAYCQGRKRSTCVRELLEHALTCPQKRQTQARAVTDTVTDTDAPQAHHAGARARPRTTTRRAYATHTH
jgi:metal-responsive CopG/Arc/MetJ family transcriptional regulator